MKHKFSDYRLWPFSRSLCFPIQCTLSKDTSDPIFIFAFMKSYKISSVVTFSSSRMSLLTFSSYYLSLSCLESCCFLATFREMLLPSSGKCEWYKTKWIPQRFHHEDSQTTQQKKRTNNRSNRRRIQAKQENQPPLHSRIKQTTQKNFQ